VEGLDCPQVPFFHATAAGNALIEVLELIKEPFELPLGVFTETVAQKLTPQKRHDLRRPAESGPEQTFL